MTAPTLQLSYLATNKMDIRRRLNPPSVHPECLGELTTPLNSELSPVFNTKEPFSGGADVSVTTT